MNSSETKYGAGFGSGHLVTKDVWNIISQLHPPEQDNDPAFVPENHETRMHDLAMAEAWFNGCNQPEHNIEINGAEKNMRGDGRNNFLFGYIRSLAKEKALYGDDALLKDINGIREEIPEGTPREEQNVPSYYREGGMRQGFACDLPYEIVSGIWKEFDNQITSDPATHANRFVDLLGKLHEAVWYAYSLQELKKLLGNI